MKLGSLVSPRGPADATFNTPEPMSKSSPAPAAVDRWRLLRQKIKDAAVRKLANEMADASGQDLLKHAMKIGFILVTDKPEIAGAILQSLHDKEFLGGKPAIFLEKLALAHTNAWFDSQGAGTSRIHLLMAKKAWAKALTHLAVSSKPICWAWSVAVTTALGEFKESSEQLGTLVRSFPQIHTDPLAVIAMSASSLLAELKHYDQACAYLYDSIEKGPPHPFTETDMSFFMARMTDRWGGGRDAETAYQKQVSLYQGCAKEQGN
jgi:hypothetical protein